MKNHNTKISSERVRAVSYARVSTKEQEREGFSIDAQIKLNKDYAAANNISIAKEFVDVETARKSGREQFTLMVQYLKKQKNIRVLLVEKTDRLYRNLKDWVTLDELDIEIHFVKEGSVLSQDSRSTEKLIHGIKVLMAKNYVDNLSEETRKGMIEKAEQGIWPSFAPIGYLNEEGEKGKKIINVDPELGPLVTKLYEWYATGRFSLRELAKKAADAGFVYRKSRKPVSKSSIQTILRNRIYTGLFEWKGQIYEGSHDPLVSHALWERVQGVMDGRYATKIRGETHHTFVFSGLVTCGHCGCAMVGEIKKGKYIYYHCTGNKGKCGEPYTREETMMEQFEAHLQKLYFDDDIFQWISTALKDSAADQKADHAKAVARLSNKHKQLQHRIDEMYIDKLDGKVTRPFYNKMRCKWRAEQHVCLEQIEKYKEADDIYMDEAILLLDLARNSHKSFKKQSKEKQIRLLNILCSNSSWKHGTLTTEFNQPFDLIAETVAIDQQQKTAQTADSDRFVNWLPRPDSNQRPNG